MKMTELLIEYELRKYYSDIDPGIIKRLGDPEKYQRLGKRGADQIAFLEKATGLVLKIFGTSSGAASPGLTKAQQSFKTFYDLSKADPGNEFLPNIVEYAPFTYKGKPYLQIRMERLFEFGAGSKNWNYVLAEMAEAVETGKDFNKFWAEADKPIPKTGSITNRIRKMTRRETMQQVMIHLGKEGAKKLWDTVTKLKAVAKKNGYMLDLHDGNFMLGSDGTPIISDPFFMGWGSK